MQKLGFQVTSFTRKSRKYSSYKGNVGKIPLTELIAVLTLLYRIKR